MKKQCIVVTVGLVCKTSFGWLSSARKKPTLCDTRLSATAQPFGRQDYWQDFYERQSEDFSWYATWSDLEPFVREFIAPHDKILLPGVGCDGVLRDLYDAGYTQLDAFDYAPQSIEYCRNHMIQERYVHLQVANARNLSSCYSSNVFDAVLDKGTLDSVFLAGSTPQERQDSLHQAVSELQRVLRPGGIFWSLSAICVDALLVVHDQWFVDWQVLADGSLYTTRDGYTSNNIDGTLMVWKKPV